MRVPSYLLAAAMLLPAPALARDIVISTRAGTAGEAAIEVARQTGTSIVIADPKIARRRIPKLNGRMKAAAALRKLAHAADARAVAVGPSQWRIEAPPPIRLVSRPARPIRKKLPRAAPPPPPAVAPTPIIVIGTKRDLRIDQVPGQVSVLEGASLEAGGVGGTEKITQRLATVSSTHLGSGRNKLFIRGIADSSFTGPTQATVGQYLGDLRLTYNAPDPDLRLSDMARVEVLEGPQGTLYGAGSLGGIIRLVPNPPVMGRTSMSGIVGGSLTQDGAIGGDASATINLPLGGGDRAALRGTVDAVTNGGYIDKPMLQQTDVNRTGILGGKLAARFEFAPGWSAELMALGQRTEADDSQYADRSGDPLNNSARVPEGSKATYGMGQLVVSGEIGDVRIRSTTGIVRQNLRENYDASPQDGDARLFSQTNRTRMIATETRLWSSEHRGFGWLLGGSFTHNETVLTRAFETIYLVTNLRSPATGVRNSIDEATLYGEASLHLKSSLVATVGGRFTWSRLGGSGENVLASIALARADVTASGTMTTFLPSLSLHTEIAPQTMLFMRYQQGFRPGGFAIEGDFVRRFRDDRTGTFEIGTRHGRPGSGPFDVALSMSYTRWQDIQADFIDAIGLPSTANIGDGQIWSASMTGGVRAGKGLRIEAGLTWNESKVDQPPILFAIRARQVPNIAHVAGRIGINWSRELGRGLELTSNGWASYVGKSRLGIGPELGEAQGDYLDSGINIRVGNQSTGISLGVTNLANSRGNRFSLGTPFSTGREQITPLRPRTLRIGLDMRF